MTIKKIPQKDRHLAIASGDIQCAATTVETWIVWNANGVATTQIFQLDKSYGADGMVVKPNIAKISDLKGKTVAASAPGTAPYFTLAWMLKKNGLSIKDVKVVNLEPQAAANAMIAGTADLDAAHDLRAVPVGGARQARGRQDHRDDARLPDGDGHLRLHAEVPGRQPEGREGAGRRLLRRASTMIKADPKKSFEIMGADVKQSGEAFEKSQAYLRWQDRAANQKFFAGEHAAFSKEAADLLLEAGIIKQVPDMSKLADTRVHEVSARRATLASLAARGAAWRPGGRCEPLRRSPRASCSAWRSSSSSSRCGRRPRSAASSRRPSSPTR